MSASKKSMKQTTRRLNPGNPERPAGPFTCLNSIGIIRPLPADR